jgi:hypothetical protein
MMRSNPLHGTVLAAKTLCYGYFNIFAGRIRVEYPEGIKIVRADARPGRRPRRALAASGPEN